MTISDRANGALIAAQYFAEQRHLPSEIRMILIAETVHEYLEGIRDNPVHYAAIKKAASWRTVCAAFISPEHQAWKDGKL